MPAMKNLSHVLLLLCLLAQPLLAATLEVDTDARVVAFGDVHGAHEDWNALLRELKVVDAGGNWAFTSPLLADGLHSISATATDAAGNTSAASTQLSLTIDTGAPAAPGEPDLDATSDTGVSDTDNLTANNTPAFSGTAEAVLRAGPATRGAQHDGLGKSRSGRARGPGPREHGSTGGG